MLQRLLAFVLCVALPLPALAQTHVIAQLGTAPLVGQVASTAQLQADVTRERAVFAAAGQGLGLTTRQFMEFERRIARHELTYVIIPRHLDAMTWRTGSRVHVLHDVVIPANTHGWEVDVVEHGEILALFVPNKCGNLSLLRKPVPVIARAPVAPPAQVAAIEATPVPTPVPTPAPTASPAPYESLATSTGPVHHFRAWPLLLLIPIVALIGSHGGPGTTNIPPITTAGPPPPGPTPPPVTCPTPVPH